MRKACLTCLIALFCFGIGPSPAQTRDALRGDLEFARQKVYPALVNISVVTRTYSGGRTVRFPAAGSGVVVSPAGHVLTNYHVAGHAARILCTLPTGETIPARLVAHDSPTDLSVLKLQLDQRPNPGQPLPFATLGDSDALKVGEYVLAVGNPLTLSSSMTLGIVSNPRRVFTNFTGTDLEDLDFGGGEQTGMFTQWIQHDALILPGNSGGPLVNLRGEIVGINTRGGSGVGFATPSNLASRVLNQVLTHGEVRRGWLGVSVMPVSKLRRQQGALVASVVPDSPAARAGIEPGDVLLALDNEPLKIRFFEEVPLFYQQIAMRSAGDKVAVRLLRQGQEETVQATLAPMERFVGEEVELKSLGITVQDVTRPMALARRYPSSDGVLITSLRPGQAVESARPRIVDGDVLVSFDGQPVKDLVALRAAVARASDKKTVAVEVRREQESILTVIKLHEEERPRPGGELPKAWLGVKTQVLTPPVAEALGLGGTKGFRVTEVYPWTAARAAGLQVGDVITALDDEKLEAYRIQDAKDLQQLVESYSVGETAVFHVVRDGQPRTLTVKLEESPLSALDAEKEKEDLLEMTVRAITFMDKIKHHWKEDQTGVLVVECTSGGWANMGGLRPFDLIVKVGDYPVTDLKSFKEAMASVRKEKPEIIQFFVQRGYRTTYVFVEPDWEGPAVKKS